MSNINMGMIGSMFPATARGKTVVNGNPIHNPTGMAPRSSTIGRAAMRERTPVGGRKGRVVLTVAAIF